MGLTFGLIFVGATLLTSAIRNVPIGDLLSGVVATAANAPGAGERGFLTALLPDVAGTRASAAQLDADQKGAWGGSKDVAYELTRGIARGSQKRSTRDTASGNVSDHWTGCRECYAVDCGVASLAAGDRVAATILRRLGRSYRPGDPVSINVNVNGFRVQVLWRVADHYDHVHVGVRRLGYTP